MGSNGPVRSYLERLALKAVVFVRHLVDHATPDRHAPQSCQRAKQLTSVLIRIDDNAHWTPGFFSVAAACGLRLPLAATRLPRGAAPAPRAGCLSSTG
jgi:hypothetical protein